MKLHFLGAAKMVTGSNYLLETKTTKIVVDCGFFQGRKAEKLNYQPFAFDPSKVKAAIMTHAHIDHIGRLPAMVKSGFSNKIYATPATKDLARIMLFDSESINASKAARAGQIPLYDQSDVEKTLELFEAAEYDQRVEISDDISFVFKDAGHILGSAIVELWAEDKKIVFSGDLGNSPTPLLKSFDYIKEADYLLVESTYGKYTHEDQTQRQDVLEDVIENTFGQGGTLLIPSFSLERAQELLYELNDLVENHRVPKVPIFIDSPLAINLTNIYSKHQDNFNKEAIRLIKSGDDLFKFPGLKMTKTSLESKQINQVNPPKIIIAGSGMSTGGRILYHEMRYLPDRKNTFLIVCYQAEGTLGRKIFERAKNIKIFGKNVQVNCRIDTIGGYSAHADQPALIKWVRGMKDSLKKVFVVHGEESQAKALSQQLKDHLGLSVEIPKLGQKVNL